jgi:hypothetical protein
MAEFFSIQGTLQIVLALGVCGVIALIADADGRSPEVWGGLGIALCVLIYVALRVLSYHVSPIAYVGFLLVGFLIFLVMWAYNLARPSY